MEKRKKDKISESRIGKYCKEENFNWKGGKETYYRRIARKVMENHINRKLKLCELVHHKDLDWKNNIITNLYLLPSQSEHMRIHNLVFKLKKAEKEVLIINGILQRC